MKSTLTKKLLVVLMGLFALACLYLGLTPCPDYKKDNAFTDNSGYIYVEKLWPSPDSEVRLGCYAKKNLSGLLPNSPLNNADGVGIRFNTKNLLTLETPSPNDENGILSFEQRVFLYVDGKQRLAEIVYSPTETMIGYGSGKVVTIPLATTYTYSSRPFLLVGDHAAKIVIITRSRKIIEYEWHFKINW